MNAGYSYQQRLGKRGIFYNQDDSQAIVTTGEFTPAEVADYYVIKFGGDWGGLWGNPELWGKLSPKGGNKTRIIPMVYCLPDHWSSYKDIVGGLLNLGYPAVILDVEMEWAGSESVYYQLLSQLNLDENLVPITGYAWFHGWPDGGKAFKKVTNTFNTVYMPQCYLSDWNNEVQGIAQIERDMTDFHLYLAPLMDAECVGAVSNHLFKPTTFAHSPGNALWCEETTSQDERQTYLAMPPVADIPLPDERTVNQRVNDSLGQGIEYVNQLLQFREGMTQQQIDLVTGISDAIHNARKMNGGE